MDRNSYNSGDWFNILDFSYERNGWGGGMPPFGDNQANWSIVTGLLGNPALGDLDRRDIRRTVQHMREMLRIRKSCELFRLRTGREVIERVEFHNTGPDQVPGLIVMSLRGQQDIEVVVLFNASTEAQTFFFDTGAEAGYSLHEVQQASNDPVVRTSVHDNGAKTFFVPARTTAVFVIDH